MDDGKIGSVTSGAMRLSIRFLESSQPLCYPAPEWKSRAAASRFSAFRPDSSTPDNWTPSRQALDPENTPGYSDLRFWGIYPCPRDMLALEIEEGCLTSRSTPSFPPLTRDLADALLHRSVAEDEDFHPMLRREPSFHAREQSSWRHQLHQCNLMISDV